MTSAWELSYSRRSRFSRIDPDVGFYRTSPHNHGYRGHRIDLHGHPLPVHRRVSDGSDPVRSTPHEIHHAVDNHDFLPFLFWPESRGQKRKKIVQFNFHSFSQFFPF